MTKTYSRDRAGIHAFFKDHSCTVDIDPLSGITVIKKSIGELNTEMRTGDDILLSDPDYPRMMEGFAKYIDLELTKRIIKNFVDSAECLRTPYGTELQHFIVSTLAPVGVDVQLIHPEDYALLLKEGWTKATCK